MSFLWHHPVHGTHVVGEQFRWVYDDASMERPRSGRGHLPFDERVYPRLRSNTPTALSYQLWWLVRFTDNGEFQVVFSDSYYPRGVPTRRTLANVAGQWIERRGQRAFHVYEPSSGREIPWWSRPYEVWKVGAQGWRSGNPIAR